MSRGIGRLRAARSVALAALTVLALTACPGERTAHRAAQRPAGTLVVTSLNDVSGLNPLIASASELNQEVAFQLFARLLRERADFESGPPTFEPYLATGYTWSEDGLELTFDLRPDAVWSDGEPLTAADVVWTWEGQIHPDVAWAYADRKEGIETVEALDPHTVRFRFRERYPDQLADANVGVVLPRHAWGERPFAEWRADAGWFRDRMVTSGPFRLASWAPEERLVLARNERYFEPDLPRLERVVFEIIPDKGAQVERLLSGDVDYVRAVPPQQIDRIERQDDLVVEAIHGRQYDYLCWNLARSPFDEFALRRAVTLALDRNEVIEAVYRGYARPALGPILTSVWAFHTGLEPWPYDPEAARALLAEAGFVDADGDGVRERDGVPLAIEVVVSAGYQVQVEAVTLFQEQLRRVGVRLELQALEFNTWVEKVLGGDFDLSIGSWSIDTALDLTYAFHSDKIGDGGYNFGAYSNPEADRLIDAAKSAGDPDAKRELLWRAQEMLHEELPYTFLWEPEILNAFNRRVRDAEPNALSPFYNLERWRVEGAEAGGSEAEDSEE